MAKRGSVLVLDVGTSAIKGVAARILPSGFEVLGYAQERTRGMDVTGVKDAVALKESAATVLTEIDEQIGKTSYEEARVIFSDDTYSISWLSHEIDLDSEGPVVIDRAVLDELLAGLGKEEGFEMQPTTVLHVFPMQYTLDGTRKVVNPLELEAKRLAVDAYTVTVSSEKEDVIRQVIQGIVEDVPISFYSPGVAAGYASTTEAEREQGSLVVDLGHSFVTVTSFVNGFPVSLAVSTLGFRYVIKDVSKVFNTSVSEAERLVKTFGHSSMNPPDAEVEVEYYALDGRTRRRIRKRELSMVIYARLRELLNKARKAAFETISSSIVPSTEFTLSSVILTGGGAKLPGVEDTTSEVFKGFVRAGSPESGSHAPVEGPDEVLRDPAYSTCIGALMMEAKSEPEGTPPRKKKTGFLDILRELFGW